MGRPKKAIRTQVMTSGRYRVSFAEAPDAWHRSPETVEARAIVWARRNCDRLLASKDTALSFEAVTAGFFRSAGPWHERMTAKEIGRAHV